MMIRLRGCRAVAAYLSLGCGLLHGSAQGIAPDHLVQRFSRAQLIIVAAATCIQFDLYIAATREQRAQGLMHVRSMDRHEGMLFSYAESSRISMWMKNTLISLDMLFFDAEFKIAAIHEQATPMSTDIIDSGAIVAGVLELNGGAATHFGIVPGNQLLLFRNLP